MEETLKKKQFVQLQFSLLLLALTTLPDFGDMISSAIGLGGMSIPVILGRVIGLIGGCLALKGLYATMGKDIPTSYLCVTCVGMVLVLISFIPDTPMWLDYVALILLFCAVYMGKNSLQIEWKSESTQGAYLVLLATLMHVYYNIDDKIATAIAALIGLFIFMSGLKKLGIAMDAEGKNGVGKLKTAAWIGIIGSIIMIIFGWIPAIGFLLGIIVGIANIIAFIIEFMGYGRLKNAEPLHESGHAGAGKLRSSMLITILAVILGWIPVIGIVGGILTLVALWFVFKGWTLIIRGLEEE